MLENFRKYTGLMIVVLILLFVGLVFFADNASKRGLGRGKVVIEIDGRGYTEKEFQRMAQSPLRMLNDLAQQSFQARFAIAPYLYELGSRPGADPDPRHFLAHRLILKKGMTRFGVYPSTADVEDFIRETIFLTPEGNFNQEAYTKYKERSLPRLGMNVKDMNDLLREVLALQTIQDIIGAGLNSSPDMVREMVEDRQQQIDFQLVTFPASALEADQTPTEEEVRTYWEENKGVYLSDAERRISYILAEPDFDALLAEKKKNAEKTPDTPEPNADGTTEEDPAPVALTQKEREAAVLALNSDLDVLWDELRKAEGNGFEELAKKAGFEIKTTELFTSATAPVELKTSMRDSQGKRATDVIFTHDVGTTAFDAISDVRIVDQTRRLLFRVDEAIEPADLTFEQARDEAKLDLVQMLSREAMEGVAEEAHKKLTAALEAGKSFKDAAAELELTPVARTAATSSARPIGEPTPTEIFDHASKVNPGKLSEVLTQNIDSRSVNRSLIVFVEKRELVDNEANRNMVDQRVNSMGSAYRRVALTNWISQQFAASNVREPAP